MKELRVAASVMVLAMSLLLGCDSMPLATRPTYKLTPAQLDARLPVYQANQTSLASRVIAIARTNLGQPYDLYLLGEAPFETIDPQPVYNLQKSDCVVFVEHSLAMGLSNDFPSFLRILQRIRYQNGEIGVRTRNHYTETDWNVHNRWLVHEITDEIGGENVKHYKQVVDRKAFFKERYKIDVDVAKQTDTESYIPYEKIPDVKSQLRTGDIVNFVKGTSDSSAWVHHLGFVAVMPDGEVHIIHSSQPRVKEEPIEAFIQRNTVNNAKNDARHKARHRGFKFLRLNDDPMSSLKAIDGDSIRITLPPSSPLSFDEYAQQQLKLGH